MEAGEPLGKDLVFKRDFDCRFLGILITLALGITGEFFLDLLKEGKVYLTANVRYTRNLKPASVWEI